MEANVAAGVSHLVETMERTAHTLIYCSEENKDFLVAKDLLDLPSIVGRGQICSWIWLQVEARERAFSGPL